MASCAGRSLNCLRFGFTKRDILRVPSDRGQAGLHPPACTQETHNAIGSNLPIRNLRNARLFGAPTPSTKPLVVSYLGFEQGKALDKVIIQSKSAASFCISGLSVAALLNIWIAWGDFMLSILDDITSAWWGYMVAATHFL